MAEKKEFIKKSLGITEYPWSSDEEENDTRQPDIATANMRSFDNMMHRANTSSASLFHPSTSTPATNAPTMASAPSSSARARMDRNRFWSLVCHPPNVTQVDLVQRQAEAMARHREMVRTSNLSRRPEGLARSRTSPLREIRGILAIKKATRQITSARNLSYPSLFTGQQRGPQFHIRKNPLFTKRPSGTPAHMCFPKISSSRPAEEPQPSTSSSRHQPHDDVHISERRASDVIESIDVDTTNTDDCNILDSALEEAGPSNVNEAPNVSTEISLEEEVLEVEEPAQGAEAGGEDNVDESEPREAAGAGAGASDEPGAGAGDEPGAEAAPGSPDEARGLKRKRDGSVSGADTTKNESVKELNACLLRLLECPVCLEWMEPPMSQCRRGHLVCVKCRARISSCPVCRTTFSSVRNRAMEGVAEMLRYPCRHGCNREVRLRRRASHEANCARRRYPCPAAACAARPPLPHKDLPHHFQTKHMSMVKLGRKQKFSVKVNAEQHDNWIIMALHEIFHLRIDVDIRTWGVTIYVAFVGPKNVSRKYMYEVTVVGKHNARQLVYSRATHSDLESASLNVCRQDCFHLSLDQALNFLRIKNRHCETDNSLNVSVTISKNETDLDREDSCDS